MIYSKILKTSLISAMNMRKGIRKHEFGYSLCLLEVLWRVSLNIYIVHANISMRILPFYKSLAYRKKCL